ncbi:hypothetical protein [Yoonia sp. I 8.24]|uniref:hypothetical protein n=1 Tax=Yoonia sp. I 8.24 TaxID=1537229 RepID=UPI001EDD7270|nr:hypothetical protein [Yoonia sp. I 8.24]MCG3267772.1 hypothetical protein [Yoonia sp. I 8.24]
MRRGFDIISRLLTTFVLLLALGAGGLSAPVKQPTLTDDVIAYLAAGGSFSDLCGNTTDPSKASGGHCPACHLIAAAVLPDALTSAPITLPGDYTRLVATAQNMRNAQSLDPARLSRAPPQA